VSSLTSLAASALAFAVVLASPPALAAPTDPPRSASAQRAEERFRAASDAFDQGRIDEACAAFAESAELYPALGTLLNLALCHEQQGKTATAWREFAHAAAWADDASQRDRREFARQHAAHLERRLVRVELDVPADAVHVDLAIDGEPVPGLRRSLPVFLDPGEHAVAASAPGFKTSVTKITVAEAPGSGPLVVHIPPPEPESAPSGASGVAVAVSERPTLRRDVGWVLGGAGLVSLGVGAAIGVDALVQARAIPNPCTGRCSTGAATTLEAASLAAVGAGLGAAAVGGWLLLADRSAPPSTRGGVHVVPQIVAKGGGLAVAGRF